MQRAIITKIKDEEYPKFRLVWKKMLTERYLFGDRYRVGSGEWSSAIGTTYSETWTHTVQFKATAPYHEEASGTFMITINPAPLHATISAEDLNYTGAAQTPVVTTNVTGHVKPDVNQLTCEFREEAGEWQSDVPSFTQPGEYKLFFRVSAPNHATFTTNCTFTIVGWDFLVNLDGQSGYPTPLRVTDPGWFLRNTAYTSEQFAVPADRYEKLDEVQPNGLKLWHNYVIEREDLSERLYAAIHQACSRVVDNCFEIRFPNVSALRNTGLAVNFRLDRKLKGENAFTPGSLTDKYELNVPLGPHDPTGLYVYNIVLTPTNELYSGQAVLASCATVGVLRVSSSATNTVTVAPWLSAAKGEEQDEPVAVSEVVNPNGLSAGDKILAYVASNDTFHAWTHESGTSWGSMQTVSARGVSTSEADTAQLARGNAFWLVRSDPSAPFYLIGRYTGDQYSVDLAGGTTNAPGYTLVANPTFQDVDLNDLVFAGASPAADDRIVMQDKTGIDKFYVRKDGEWGRYVTKKVGGRIRQTWEAGGTVPSGTGFWYVRTKQDELSIRFEGAK